MNVVSLVPSVTETLLAWGVTPVAVTRFCEQPSLPAVGGTKDPDLDAIAALAPDLVVLNDEENRREDADALAALGIPLHVITVRSVADVGAGLQALAAAVGVPTAAFEVPAVLAPIAPRRRAFVPIWRRPYMTLAEDTYGASLLATIGVETVLASGGGRYPEVTLDEAAAAAPDVVLAPSEPYPFTERQRSELEQVAPVVFVDGQDLFWWGIRSAAAQSRLAAQLAPA